MRMYGPATALYDIEIPLELPFSCGTLERGSENDVVAIWHAMICESTRSSHSSCCFSIRQSFGL